jgi:hypothetical protein
MFAVARPRFSGLLSLGLWTTVLIACGGDDATHGDAGSMDASMRNEAGPTHIPRPDAQVSANDPVPPCDRADRNSCGAGDTCDLVYRRAPGATQFIVYPGCVKVRRERALGDPCDPDFSAGELYKEPGLLDDVYTDPCGPGLICAPDRAVRGGSSCQPLCSSGMAAGDSPIACMSESALCFGASQFVEFCRESERCDVAKQAGCNSGEACYMRPTGDGQRMLAVCRPKPTMPIADGEACSKTGYYGCNPGSLCLGPVRVPRSLWADADIQCRPVCAASTGADLDAGIDDDAGVVRGGCGLKARCIPFAESGLSLAQIPRPPYGQCER